MTKLYGQVKNLNGLLRTRDIDYPALSKAYGELIHELNVLGLSFDLPKLSEEDIALFEAYNQAKAEKDFAKSDILRAKLMERNIL